MVARQNVSFEENFAEKNVSECNLGKQLVINRTKQAVNNLTFLYMFCEEKKLRTLETATRFAQKVDT